PRTRAPPCRRRRPADRGRSCASAWPARPALAPAMAPRGQRPTRPAHGDGSSTTSRSPCSFGRGLHPRLLLHEGVEVGGGDRTVEVGEGPLLLDLLGRVQEAGHGGAIERGRQADTL